MAVQDQTANMQLIYNPDSNGRQGWMPGNKITVGEAHKAFSRAVPLH